MFFFGVRRVYVEFSILHKYFTYLAIAVD